MTSIVINFLLVDDDATFCSTLARTLERKGFSCKTAHSIDEAIALAHHIHFEKAVIDLKLGNSSGLTLIKQLHQQQPWLDSIMLTGYSSIATAVTAIKAGAINYLCKPVNAEEVLAAFNADINTPTPDEYSPPSVDRLEWEHIQKVLQQHEGNISATARSLGMHRRTLQRKLQKRPVKQ